MAEGSRRLSALEGFAPAPAAATPARRAGRPRILFENLDDIGLEELPDVAHELRTLRRILDLNRKLARATDEGALLDAFLDGALALSGAERAFLLGAGEGDATCVLRSRDRGGQRVAETRGGAGPAARRVLAGGRAEVV